jgi:hypothetical protein
LPETLPSRLLAPVAAVVLAVGASVTATVLTAPEAAADPAPSCVAAVCTVTFAATGAVDQWTVPAGVTSVAVTLAAGSGASSTAGGQGGQGGRVAANVPVTWGEQLTVVVGLAGADGGSGGNGGFGGGGSAGIPQGGRAGGGGGGGSFLFETTGGPSTLLIAAGGGGGGGGNSSTSGGAGAVQGPGADGTSASTPTAGGGGAGIAAGGSGGLGAGGPVSKGSAGSGPATSANAVGHGGAGGNSPSPSPDTTGGGGGGGYFGGGGGGVQDPLAIFAGGGGGGTGYLDPSATQVSVSTNTGDGSVVITYAEPATTTTSGFLRDSATGDPIPNSCVVFSPASSPGSTNYTNVNGNGSWSFDTQELGPFDLAFYTTANGDCSQPILATPVPSWYSNQVLTGTDEHLITPPVGASTVAAGASGIVACLGATALPTTACVTPDGVLSGTVLTTNSAPLANVCVIALAGNGDGDPTVTDANGHWSLTGLPKTFSVVVAFIPGFGTGGNPCDGGNGPPPVPPAGALQPVFYGDVWLDLGDPSLLNDAHTWAVAHGARIVTGPSTTIDACITTAAGSVRPRPACVKPILSAANADPIANTGARVTPLIDTGGGLVGIGVLVLLIAARSRPRRREPRR